MSDEEIRQTSLAIRDRLRKMECKHDDDITALIKYSHRSCEYITECLDAAAETISYAKEHISILLAGCDNDEMVHHQTYAAHYLQQAAELQQHASLKADEVKQTLRNFRKT